MTSPHGASERRNPYRSPDSSSSEHPPRSAGAAWGLLIGAIHGCTYGAIGGLVLSALLTVFFAITRLPGWFGPVEGMLVRLVLYLGLAAMVGGVGGMMVGAFGGVMIGLFSLWARPATLSRLGALWFAVSGGMLIVIAWGQEMMFSGDPLQLGAYGLGILTSACFAAFAGKKTGTSIARTLETLEREAKLAQLSGE